LVKILFKDAVNSTLGTNIADLAPNNFPRTDLVAAFLTGIDGVNANGSVAEMIRLNTAIAPVAKDKQSTFGVAGDDLAGFPNGRRPSDDVVDIALRVLMGILCYEVPVKGTPTNLGFCTPENAPVGNQPITGGLIMNKYLLILLFALISNSLWATSYDTDHVTLNIYVFKIKELTKLGNETESNDIFSFADQSLNLSEISVIANGEVI
jgi:hypothetical protein